ncbi:MAG: inositol 2-dehydrogenase [Xanthomonadales bacterium]|nr:inositol 2-dehydrogenase [Xanthomonadales bacterium]
MISICLFGAGRIGRIHAANVAARDDVELRYVVDVDQASAAACAAQHGAAVSSVEQALNDHTLDAVIIGSPTDTHADLISRSAQAGKAIFCEKPIDLDIGRVDACLAVVEQCGVPLALGFNRRYDPSFASLKARLDGGSIGKVEMVTITSRDPAPPPAEYAARSGGIFRDMMIHDLDMARWLLPEEPVEVFATASCLVDPAIGAAGDVDTAMVVMRTAGGILCHISNSRRAVYGYDQRIEVFGSGGMLRAENERNDTVQHFSADGTLISRVPDFFIDRYEQAYRRELNDFVDMLTNDTTPAVSGKDGRQALVLADAAQASLERGAIVRL